MSTNGVVEGFTREQVEQFEALLLERRNLLLKDYQALEEAEARDASQVASASTHLADLGSDRAASDISLGCRVSASGEIQQIDEALERIRDGSFGCCETCDLRISGERLGAIPYARLCLSCKMREEL